MLTPREKQVLQQIFSGLTNREIAEALGLAPNYIKGVVHRIYVQLGIHSDRELFPMVIMAQTELRRESIDRLFSPLTHAGETLALPANEKIPAEVAR